MLLHLSARAAVLTVAVLSLSPLVRAEVGVGAKPPADAEVLIDGTRETLDQKWTYWEGPRFSSALPIKWQIVNDPVDEGTVLMTDDPAAAGGKYGTADIVTKQKYRDFRLHVEFLVMKKGGNSGVYLQNRYEIQILDGDRSKHGMGAVINETDSPYDAYRGVGQWNAYDIVFRAARFQDGQRVEKALVTMYFNGKKVHENVAISKVWGGANSGLDGGNDNGFGITDTAGGLKLQCEGHDVRYRNTWIKELDLAEPNTEFSEPVVSAQAAADQELPRVLIIGDSISIGYTPFVREMLQGEAIVAHNPGNAQHTGVGLEKLQAWLGDEQWDVIHFNWGLHDLCYRHPDAKASGRRDKVNGTLTNSLQVYEANLQQLVQQLKQTGATLIWANTTVVPEGEAGRKLNDDLRYNEVAAKVMQQHDIPINDLNATSRSFDAALFSGPGNVHFTKDGSRQLAQQVVEAVRKVLPQTADTGT